MTCLTSSRVGGVRGLLDTCTFLWIITGSRELSPAAAKAFADPANEILRSVVSVWELLVKHALGMLPIPLLSIDVTFRSFPLPVHRLYRRPPVFQPVSTLKALNTEADKTIAIQGLDYLVDLVCLVCLVCLVEQDQLDKQNKPDRPNNGLLTQADLFSFLPVKNRQQSTDKASMVCPAGVCVRAEERDSSSLRPCRWEQPIGIACVPPSSSCPVG